MKNDLGTLSQTVNALKEEGYTLDFNARKDCLVCHNTNTVLSPEDFEIDAVFRFEGESNPEDESVVYAISSSTLSVKGVLVNAYRIYSDATSDELVRKLSQHR